jgi:hypothetical protein
MRRLDLGPPNNRPIGWVAGNAAARSNQVARQVSGRESNFVKGSRNGLHSGTQWHGPVPGVHATRPLQSGVVVNDSRPAVIDPGLQTTLAVPFMGLGARPQIR